MADLDPIAERQRLAKQWLTLLPGPGDGEMADLSEWEQKFLASVRQQFSRKADVSEKQFAVLAILRNFVALRPAPPRAAVQAGEPMKYGPSLTGDWTDEHLMRLAHSTGWWITHDSVGNQIGEWPDTRRHLPILYALALSVAWPDPNQATPEHSPVMVEIGVRHGIATMALLHAARETGGLLHSVEIDPEFAVVAKERVDEAHLTPWWELHVCDCNEWASSCPDDIDIAWIDGDHSYEQTRRDVLNYGGKVRQGGFIIMHDVANAWEPGVASVWEEMKQSGKYEMLCLPWSFGLGLAKVIA